MGAAEIEGVQGAGAAELVQPTAGDAPDGEVHLGHGGLYGLVRVRLVGGGVAGEAPLPLGGCLEAWPCLGLGWSGGEQGQRQAGRERDASQEHAEPQGWIG